MDDMNTWIYVTTVICALFIFTAIPLAVEELRLRRELAEIAQRAELRRLRRKLAEIAQRAERPLVISYWHRRIRDRFIANSVRISTFGDKRRRTAVIAEIIRPDTGPIPLPNEHVEPVS